MMMFNPYDIIIPKIGSVWQVTVPFKVLNCKNSLSEIEVEVDAPILILELTYSSSIVRGRKEVQAGFEFVYEGTVCMYGRCHELSNYSTSMDIKYWAYKIISQFVLVAVPMAPPMNNGPFLSYTNTFLSSGPYGQQCQGSGTLKEMSSVAEYRATKVFMQAANR